MNLELLREAKVDVPEILADDVSRRSFWRDHQTVLTQMRDVSYINQDALRRSSYIQNPTTGLLYRKDVFISAVEARYYRPGEAIGSALDRLYWKEGKPLMRVAEELSVSSSIVRKWLRRTQMGPRNMSQATYHAWRRSDGSVAERVTKMNTPFKIKALQARYDESWGSLGTEVLMINRDKKVSMALGESREVALADLLETQRLTLKAVADRTGLRVGLVAEEAKTLLESGSRWSKGVPYNRRERFAWINKVREVLGDNFAGLLTNLELDAINALNPSGGTAPNKLEEVKDELGLTTRAGVSLREQKALRKIYQELEKRNLDPIDP